MYISCALTSSLGKKIKIVKNWKQIDQKVKNLNISLTVVPLDYSDQFGISSAILIEAMVE